MSNSVDPTELGIRAAIDDALRSYCRGIDRLHVPSLEAAFHPGAILEGYGSADATTIEEFIPRVLDSLRTKFVATQHRISNVTIEIEGDRALVETYVLAHHVVVHADGRTLITFNGRYIDTFEGRGGDWRIARRQLRIDWSDISPMGDPMQGAYVPSGRDGTPDPVFG
jgi:SnoaL-like domain